MRIIDANKLDDVVVRLNSQDWQITRGEYKLINRVLFEFPSVDAVPVVRCKDCKHWSTLIDRKNAWFGFCVSLKELSSVTPKDGYCYKAERRGEQNEID